MGCTTSELFRLQCLTILPICFKFLMCLHSLSLPANIVSEVASTSLQLCVCVYFWISLATTEGKYNIQRTSSIVQHFNFRFRLCDVSRNLFKRSSVWKLEICSGIIVEGSTIDMLAWLRSVTTIFILLLLWLYYSRRHSVFFPCCSTNILTLLC